MITLSNGAEISVVLDCVLGINGRGTPLEWAAILKGKLHPELHAVISKTITDAPIAGWPWDPLLRVRYLGCGNWVNAYGLLNPGRVCGQKVLEGFADRVGQAIISVFACNPEEAVRLAQMANNLDAIALEMNASCPNVHKLSFEEITEIALAFHEQCRLPLIVKLSAEQDVEIALRLREVVEIFNLTNTIRFETVFHNRESPLARYGGGGVSGPIIHPYAQAAITIHHFRTS